MFQSPKQDEDPSAQRQPLHACVRPAFSPDVQLQTTTTLLQFNFRRVAGLRQIRNKLGGRIPLPLDYLINYVIAKWRLRGGSA